jgi:hypothetical protein
MNNRNIVGTVSSSREEAQAGTNLIIRIVGLIDPP